jgi:hypothetical protein
MQKSILAVDISFTNEMRRIVLLKIQQINMLNEYLKILLRVLDYCGK